MINWIGRSVTSGFCGKHPRLYTDLSDCARRVLLTIRVRARANALNIRIARILFFLRAGQLKFGPRL